MRSLKLYFPYRSQRTPLVDYALLLTGGLLLLGVAYQFKQITTDVHAWEVREAHFMQQQKENRQSKVPIARIRKVTQQEVKQVNAVLQQLDLPWEQLFDALEMADSPDIALLSLQPDVSGKTIRLTGEARHLAAAVEYVQALELEPALKHAHLVSYKTRQDHPYHPIIFSMSAMWQEPQ